MNSFNSTYHNNLLNTNLLDESTWEISSSLEVLSLKSELVDFPRSDRLGGAVLTDATFTVEAESEAVEGDITGLVDRVTEEAQERLTEFAREGDVAKAMGIAFETTVEDEAVADLLTDWLIGDFEDFPEVEVLGEDKLENASGAYSEETGKIYLSENFLAMSRNDVTVVVDVLLEEYGHAVDSQVNREDSPGDEGAIFSALVRSEALTSAQWDELKAEDDKAQIEIDGQSLTVEQASVGGSGGVEGSRQTLNLGASGGVPLAIQYGMQTIPDRLIVRYEGRNIVDTGFVSGSQSLKVNVPNGQSETVSVVLATNDAATQWSYSVNTDVSSLDDTGDAGPGDPVQPVPTESRDVTEEKRNEETGSQDCKATVPGTSEVELHSGAVMETHSLVPYQALGSVRGLTLQYDSLRADPSQIVYFGFDDVPTNRNLNLVAEMSVSKDGETFQVPGYQGTDFGLDGGEHIWSIAGDGNDPTSDVSAALQVDLSGSETGVYSYDLTTGLKELTNGVFTGSSDVETGEFISVNSINSDFGRGWSLAGLQELVENSDGSILLVDGDGSELLFEPSMGMTGMYESPPGDNSMLERLADGTFRRTFMDRTVTTFNAANQLATVTDTNGNTTTYVYDGENNLTQIVDPVGLTTTLGYENGKVTSIVDPAGRVTEMTYDEFGNLVRVTDPDGLQRNWEYDAEGRMIAENDQRGNREEMVYDFAGRADMATLKDGSQLAFDPVQSQGLYPADRTIDPSNAPSAFILDDDPVATYTDANGKTITNVLDQKGQVVASFDEEGALPTVTRNANNLIATQTDARGNTTSFEYDANGNVTSIQDAISGAAARTFEYEPMFNQLTREVDELGRQTLYEVDPANGNLLSVTQVVGDVGGDDDIVTRFTYTSRGLLDTITDDLGRVTDNDYDALGRLAATTFAVGTADEATQRFEYDAAGNRTAAIDENGNRTTFEYDINGRLTAVIDAQGNATRYTYDAAGNVTQTTDSRGNVTTSLYDERDRLTEVIDAQNQVSRFVYDSEGNLTQVVDPQGNAVQYQYDSRNRVTTTIDPNTGATTFGYDADNNLASITDSVGNTTQYQYDARNRVVTEVQTSQPENPTTFEYDVVDNLTARVDRNGRRTEFAYDDLDRVLAETWVGGNNTIQYAYDAVGNIASVNDAFSSLAYGYDSQDRIQSVSSGGANGVPNVTLTYDYDALGNVIQVSDSIEGQAAGVTGYAYDSLNRLATLTQTGANVSDKRVDFAYNELGQMASVRRYGDLAASNLVAATSYGYDELNRVASIVHDNPTETVAFFNYAYDDGGRISQIDERDGSTVYSYDGNGQLVGSDSSVAGKPDEAFAYDANGNRVSSSQHESYVTGAHNKLLSDGEFTYEYDNEGNRIRQVNVATGEVREFTWDYRNRLVAIVDRDESGAVSQEVEYAYDALDRRILKSVDDPRDAVPEEVTYFVYNGEDVHLEFVDSDGVAGASPLSLALRYLHGANTDEILAQDSGDGQVSWRLTDHLGSARVLVDEVGEVTNRITYGSFGEVISQTDEAETTRYLFTGREFDEESSLYFYRSRYYDSSTGSFISDDIIGFSSGVLNLSEYVHNNPLSFADPDGQVATSEGSKVVLRKTSQAANKALGEKFLRDQVVKTVTKKAGGALARAGIRQAASTVTGPGTFVMAVVNTGFIVYDIYDTSKTVKELVDSANSSNEVTGGATCSIDNSLSAKRSYPPQNSLTNSNRVTGGLGGNGNGGNGNGKVGAASPGEDPNDPRNPNNPQSPLNWNNPQNINNPNSQASIERTTDAGEIGVSQLKAQTWRWKFLR